MTRLRASTALALAIALSPAAALAHPGDHVAMTLAQVGHHIVTSPDHLAEVIMAGLMIVGLVIRQRRRAQ